MKRIAIAIAAIAAMAVGGVESAQAQDPSLYPFVPFGVYQPYGARYGTRTPTPPYFSLNPPVYYGARHARPYGMSPFAAPPMVSAPQGYKGRLRSGFAEPEFQTPPPPEKPMPTCGHCCQHVYQAAPVKVGLVQSNPFVASETKLAKN